MTTEYLIELIKNNTRVIIPEFGAFLIKDDGSGVFKPDNLTFSPFLRYNDGMLEDNIASKNKTSKDKAKESLTNYTEILKQELTEKGAFELKGIGVLSVDKRGSIHFDPITSETKTATETPKTEIKIEAQKKEEIKAPKLEEKKEEAKEKKEVAVEKPVVEKKIEEVVAKESPKVEPKTELKATPTKLEPQKPQSFGNKTTKPIKTTEPNPVKQKRSGGTGKAILMGTLMGLALVALLAGGWYLYDTGFFSSNKTKANKQFASDTKVLTEPDQTVNEPADEKSELAKEAKGEDKKEGKFDDEFSKLSAQMDKTSDDGSTPKADETRISKTVTPQSNKVAASYVKEGIYHLVVGSFRNISYAEKYADEMKTSGYKSRVITQSTGMHAVSLGSFLTRQEAEDSMNVWKAQHPNIWILNQ